MTHCDFGWGAKANGYYVSGVLRQEEKMPN